MVIDGRDKVRCLILKSAFDFCLPAFLALYFSMLRFENSVRPDFDLPVAHWLPRHLLKQESFRAWLHEHLMHRDINQSMKYFLRYLYLRTSQLLMFSITLMIIDNDLTKFYRIWSFPLQFLTSYIPLHCIIITTNE